MWTVSVLWERRGGTIKEKVEECECGKEIADSGSWLAFVNSSQHGLTNDRQLFLGLRIIDPTCGRCDPDRPFFVSLCFS